MPADPSCCVLLLPDVARTYTMQQHSLTRSKRSAPSASFLCGKSHAAAFVSACPRLLIFRGCGSDRAALDRPALLQRAGHQPAQHSPGQTSRPAAEYVGRVVDAEEDSTAADERRQQDRHHQAVELD